MEELWAQVGGILLQILGIVVLAMAAWALRWLQRRFDVKLSAEMEDAIRATARAGIRRAEEWAAGKIKVSQKVNGADKARVALELVKSRWPKVADHELVGFIEGEIAAMSGVGATGDRVVGGGVFGLELAPPDDEDAPPAPGV